MRSYEAYSSNDALRRGKLCSGGSSSLPLRRSFSTPYRGPTWDFLPGTLSIPTTPVALDNIKTLAIPFSNSRSGCSSCGREYCNSIKTARVLIRFLVGGAVVSVFALIGDLVKPKSFAGLFGAAPSVALATLGADGSDGRRILCRHGSPLYDGRCNRIHSVCLVRELGHDALQPESSLGYELLNSSVAWGSIRSLVCLAEIAMQIKVDLSVLGQTRWYEYAIRFIFGGLITAVAGIIARLGRGVGGLFLAFPAIFPASATLIEKHETQKKEEEGLQGTQRGRKSG